LIEGVNLEIYVNLLRNKIPNNIQETRFELGFNGKKSIFTPADV